MLYATNRFPGDGMTTQYEISFVGGYLDRTHVKAYVEGADLVRTPVTLSPGNFLGQYTIGGIAPVPVGSTLVIYRDTPKAPIVDFVNGSRFTESNLDTATRQGSFIAAEGADAVSPAGLAGVIQQIVDFSGAAGVARDQAVGAKNTVVASSDAASLSASNANDSALSAATDAASALSNKNLSATAAFNASTSAAQAQGFRNTASTHATNAGNSATAAAGSATTASNAQAAVALSASNAAASAAAAASTAQQVADNTASALASKNEAAASALSAATSATQSANSATAADTAKTAAETARDSAISSATNAGTSASTATTQAGIATTKATQASNSASAAAWSASAASASASAAASNAALINPASLMTLAGTQTVSGAKTFSIAPEIPSLPDPAASAGRALNWASTQKRTIINGWGIQAGVVTNLVYMGWSGIPGGIRAQVDATPIGSLVTTDAAKDTGMVGALVFGHYIVGGSSLAHGTQVAGSDLRATSGANFAGGALPGTWVCLGAALGNASGTTASAKTLFMRVA